MPHPKIENLADLVVEMLRQADRPFASNRSAHHRLNQIVKMS
jgi:hypothetical protein